MSQTSNPPAQTAQTLPLGPTSNLPPTIQRPSSLIPRSISQIHTATPVPAGYQFTFRANAPSFRPVIEDGMRNPFLKFLPMNLEGRVKVHNIIKEGRSIAIGRLKIVTPKGDDYIIRRYDTGDIALSSMLASALSGATDQQVAKEVDWVRSVFGLRGMCGRTADGYPAPLLDGIWVTAETATQIAPTYGLKSSIEALIRVQPDSAGALPLITQHSTTNTTTDGRVITPKTPRTPLRRKTYRIFPRAAEARLAPAAAVLSSAVPMPTPHQATVPPGQTVSMPATLPAPPPHPASSFDSSRTLVQGTPSRVFPQPDAPAPAPAQPAPPTLKRAYTEVLLSTDNIPVPALPARTDGRLIAPLPRTPPAKTPPRSSLRTIPRIFPCPPAETAPYSKELRWVRVQQANNQHFANVEVGHGVGARVGGGRRIKFAVVDRVRVFGKEELAREGRNGVEDKAERGAEEMVVDRAENGAQNGTIAQPDDMDVDMEGGGDGDRVEGTEDDGPRKKRKLTELGSVGMGMAWAAGALVLGYAAGSLM